MFKQHSGTRWEHRNRNSQAGSAERLRKSSVLSYSQLRPFPLRESAVSGRTPHPSFPTSGPPQLPAMSGEVIPWTRTAFFAYKSPRGEFSLRDMSKYHSQHGNFCHLQHPWAISQLWEVLFGSFKIATYSFTWGFLAAIVCESEQTFSIRFLHATWEVTDLCFLPAQIGWKSQSVNLFSIWKSPVSFVNISCILSPSPASFVKWTSKVAIFKCAMHLYCSINIFLFVHDSFTNSS